MDDENDNRPPHRGLKKGLFVIPTLFTAANVAMGFLAVMMSIRGYHASFGDLESAAHYFNMAALAIGLAILFDTIDGRVARATRTATEIGVQFDSLADVLTFGIAPTALVYAWSFGGVYTENSLSHNVGMFLLFAYLMCGAFRLARFNLQATRPVKLEEGATKVDKKNFVGLPIPLAGGLLASIIHFAPMPLSSYGEVSGPILRLCSNGPDRRPWRFNGQQDPLLEHENRRCRPAGHLACGLVRRAGNVRISLFPVRIACHFGRIRRARTGLVGIQGSDRQTRERRFENGLTTALDR
ncbi:MAG: CDP-alcohol phosphatidyltransferase family protein [Acidobacteria bacterium]|nr:CDP-alcohol phosphatidyltransferase family protein [Acidobacteriota bacterium]